jgi:hypothetical protein
MREEERERIEENSMKSSALRLHITDRTASENPL